MRRDWDSISRTEMCDPQCHNQAWRCCRWYNSCSIMVDCCFFLQFSRCRWRYKSKWLAYVSCLYVVSLALTFALCHILAAALAAAAVWRPLHTVWHVSCASETRPGSLWRTPREPKEDQIESGRKSQHRCYMNLVTFQSKKSSRALWKVVT